MRIEWLLSCAALALLVSPAFAGGTFQSVVNSDNVTHPASLPQLEKAVGGNLGNHRVFPPQSYPVGKSYGGWAAAYIQWVVTNPVGGTVFGENESDKVLFVEPGCADRTYTMPASAFLLAPIWWAWNEYGCPWDPPLSEIPSLEDYLLEGLAYYYPPPEEVPALGWEVLIDGRPVNHLNAYLAVSSMFDVTFDPSWGAAGPGGDPCVVEGAVQACVAGGYFIMLKPLQPGSHTLEYRGVCDPPTTIHLNVVTKGKFSRLIAGSTGAETPTWSVVKNLYR